MINTKKNGNRVAKIVMLMVMCIASVSIAFAQQHPGFGVGVMAGEPTGLSLKWGGASNAFAAGAAWSFSGSTAMHLHLDFIRHTTLFGLSEKTPFHYGLGGRVKLYKDDPLIGARVPVGISYLFDAMPIDVFLEIVPILDVLPDVDFGINSAIGARYYF